MYEEALGMLLGVRVSEGRLTRPRLHMLHPHTQNTTMTKNIEHLGTKIIFRLICSLRIAWLLTFILSCLPRFEIIGWILGYLPKVPVMPEEHMLGGMEIATAHFESTAFFRRGTAEKKEKK